MHRRFVTGSLLLLVIGFGFAPGLAASERQADAGEEPHRFAEGSLPPPRFADPARLDKMRQAFPEMDRILAGFAERRHMPGFAYGIVVDGELVSSGAHGLRNVEANAQVNVDTVFRIASMTKSFTALAIVKLRDEGKLVLDDPVAKWVPELRDLAYPTRDSPVITLRDLLTHSAGFPEDNPWADRQLAVSPATFSAWMREGVPFSNAPGVAYEYSNYGFAILGQVVARASGIRYRDYVDRELLQPLGMTSTFWEASAVPRDRLATGYRWENGAWTAEDPLADGAFGSIGGLFTSVRDLARYVGFFLSAWPPRDEPDSGPVRRASLREMQQGWRAMPASASRDRVDLPLRLWTGGYGYGLQVTQDCRFPYIVSHGGGLPGYGSTMRWLPDYGVGVIALGNVTYAGFSQGMFEAFTALIRSGGLRPRQIEPSPGLQHARDVVSRLIQHWDDARAAEIATDSLFLDRSAERRKTQLADLARRHGSCRIDGPIDAENALRGAWTMPCDRGMLRVVVTLAPTMPPRVQSLAVRSVMPPDERMAGVWTQVLALADRWDERRVADLASPTADIEAWRAQLRALTAEWGRCRRGDAAGGDGTSTSEVHLACEGGELLGAIELDETGKLTRLTIEPAAESTCVP